MVRRYLFFASVELRIEGIEILGVQFILHYAQSFTETLKVYDFSCAEEFDWFTDLLIFYQTENIVVGCAGFLFCGALISTTWHAMCIGEYPYDVDLNSNIESVIGQPFSANLERQAMELGFGLKVNYLELQKLLSTEPDARAIEVLRYQLERYESIIKDNSLQILK